MLSKAEPLVLDDDHGVYGSPGDVTPWDVRYDPSNRAHLDANTDGSLRFRVWTDPSLGDGMLVVRDDESVRGYRMHPAAETMRFTYWEVVVGPLPAGSRYSFAFRSPGGRGVYRVPSGVSNAVERLDRWHLEPPDVMTVPDWAKGAVIYQIFPDRFAREGSWEDTPLHPWGTPPEATGFQGGDLLGIASRLDYLSDLGVDALYLNPIFTSPSNHRYDTVDYYSVDPMLGGNEALRELVGEAHNRQIRVILDASFNHVHPDFFAFTDVVEKGPDSDYWDWFSIQQWPLNISYRQDLVVRDERLARYVARLDEELGLTMVPRTDGWKKVEPSYEAWYGVPTMPRVDLSNSEARSYMLDVAAFWLREFDIDGWRMDVVRYVDHDFWDGFRRVTRAVRPDAFLLSEVMGDASPWLQGGRFDATMSYTFRDLCLRFFAEGETSGHAMLDGLSRAWAQYAWPVTLAAQNLIGSHDTARFLTRAGGEVWRLRLATVLQLTFPGAPGIYYGDEVGMRGDEEPESRGAFIWDDDPTGHLVHQTIRQLTQLRRAEPALARGEWRPLGSSDDVISFQRSLGGRSLVVALNRGAKPATIDFGRVDDLIWGDADIGASGVTVPARSAVILA